MKTIKYKKEVSVIKQLRNELKISQEEMARKIKISQPFLSCLERRTKKISIDDILSTLALAKKNGIFISIEDMARDYKK